jgi:hypothetical protein
MENGNEITRKEHLAIAELLETIREGLKDVLAEKHPEGV